MWIDRPTLRISHTSLTYVALMSRRYNSLYAVHLWSNVPNVKMVTKLTLIAPHSRGPLRREDLLLESLRKDPASGMDHHETRLSINLIFVHADVQGTFVA